MRRLAKIVGGCDLQDVTSLRRCYENSGGPVYYLEDIEVVCEPTHKSTPQIVHFKIFFPVEIFKIDNADKLTRSERTMMSDFMLRSFGYELDILNSEYMNENKKEELIGKFLWDKPGQSVIERNSCLVNDNKVRLLFQVKFPIHHMSKRKVVAGKKSGKMIRKDLVRAINRFVINFNLPELKRWLEVAGKQEAIRNYCIKNNLAAFIANGSILPRRKGEDLPLENAVKFISPKAYEVKIRYNDEIIKGMGMQRGITVLTGGGYSGKSTVLQALLAGVYNHIPGDGRELCICDKESFKICAEDGRPVSNTNIKPFFNWLPDEDPSAFYSDHASGSTSQAANIIEALNCKCRVLLIDEDTTATNFMMRDDKMKKIIKDDPVITFLDRARQLVRENDTSIILVIGGNGDYLDIADNVFLMENFIMHDYNLQADSLRRKPAEQYRVEDAKAVRWGNSKYIDAQTITAYPQGKKREFMQILDNNILAYGDEKIKTGALESIVSANQLSACGLIIKKIQYTMHGKEDLYETLKNFYKRFTAKDLDELHSGFLNISLFMEMPRLADVYAVISRMRNLRYLDN